MHLGNKLSNLSDSKIKEGVFNGLEIKAVMKDEDFQNKPLEEKKCTNQYA